MENTEQQEVSQQVAEQIAEVEQKTQESLARVAARDAGQIYSEFFDMNFGKIQVSLDMLSKKSLQRVIIALLQTGLNPSSFKNTAQKEIMCYNLIEKVLHAKYGWQLWAELSSMELAAQQVAENQQLVNAQQEASVDNNVTEGVKSE